MLVHAFARSQGASRSTSAVQSSRLAISGNAGTVSADRPDHARAAGSFGVAGDLDLVLIVCHALTRFGTRAIRITDHFVQLVDARAAFSFAGG